MTAIEPPAGGDLDGQTILVTGASSGIGLATARALASRGARTILGARDRQRAEQARRQVSARDEDVQVVVADLASRGAVLELVSEVTARFDRLDVLINNAGIDVGRREVTADGLELTFAVNYMAPFLLSNGLLELMCASAPARIVNLGSSGYRGGKLDFSDLQSERRFSGQRAYNNSKLALVVFTYELARRLAGSGVTVNAVDPGFVRGTGIGRTLPAGYRLLGTIMWPFMASVEKAAETVVLAATDPLLAGVTGRYFKRGREITTARPTQDEALARRLWSVSERLAGADLR